jgi:hypothetical protein
MDMSILYGEAQHNSSAAAYPYVGKYLQRPQRWNPDQDIHFSGTSSARKQVLCSPTRQTLTDTTQQECRCDVLRAVERSPGTTTRRLARSHISQRTALRVLPLFHVQHDQSSTNTPGLWASENVLHRDTVSNPSQSNVFADGWRLLHTEWDFEY